ncbi:MAG: YbaK/EbsC family protein [Clostridia bacterium]|nr:YbaK/EbsC family protein [Clostridia bacterium]
MEELIYTKLNQMDIEYEVIKHQAIYSEKEEKDGMFPNDILIGKNLFLRNANKSAYYLYSLPLHKKANLKELSLKLNEKRFSFANEEELEYFMKITPGAVSYLNVITSDCLNGCYKNVKYIIDKDLYTKEKIGFHPSNNALTVVTSPEIIEKVYNEYALDYKVIKI